MSDQAPQVVQTDGQMEPTVVDTPENEISKQKKRGDQYDQGLKHEKSLLNLRIKKVMKKQGFFFL
jgi:hypothetical protein